MRSLNIKSGCFPGLTALLVVVCASCVGHIKPYEPKSRRYDLPPEEGDSKGGREMDGGLYSEKTSVLGTDLIADNRARNIHDIVTIVVEEDASSTFKASSELEREAEVKAGISAFLGYMQAIQKANPNTNPEELINATNTNNFKGSGATERSGQVTATVPAMIKKLLGNGLLFVEGHRVLLVNSEEHHFYISGVIRPQDIDTSNAISSRLIADAQVEFTGRGDFDLNQGWFSRYLGWLWPF